VPSKSFCYNPFPCSPLFAIFLNCEGNLRMKTSLSAKFVVAIVAGIALVWLAPGGATEPTNDSAADNHDPNDAIACIKDQGLTSNSQVMATLSYLSDVIGQRLTGSPNLKRANEWTKMKLESWGLSNAHLEAWGPFGRGWELKHFSAQIVEPQVFPLIACPQAWSPGLKRPLTAEVIYLGGVTTSNLDSYKGKLAGAIVLASPMHEIVPRLEPIFARQTESNLTRLANLTGDADRQRGRPGGFGNRSGTNGNRIRPARLLAFLEKEKAGLVVNESSQGDGGTVFVASAEHQRGRIRKRSPRAQRLRHQRARHAASNHLGRRGLQPPGAHAPTRGEIKNGGRFEGQIPRGGPDGLQHHRRDSGDRFEGSNRHAWGSPGFLASRHRRNR
jgi:hypothetical protein